MGLIKSRESLKMETLSWLWPEQTVCCDDGRRGPQTKECEWPLMAGKANRFFPRAPRKECSPTNTLCCEDYEKFRIGNCKVLMLGPGIHWLFTKWHALVVYQMVIVMVKMSYSVGFLSII